MGKKFEWVQAQKKVIYFCVIFQIFIVFYVIDLFFYKTNIGN